MSDAALPDAVLTGKLTLPENRLLVSPTLIILVEGRVLVVSEGVIECQWTAEKEGKLRKPAKPMPHLTLPQQDRRPIQNPLGR